MTERLIAKLERLGAEADIKEMTPEIFQFALGVRADLAAEWPKRSWVGLTDEEIWSTVSRIGSANLDVNPYTVLIDARAIEAKLKAKNT